MNNQEPFQPASENNQQQEQEQEQEQEQLTNNHQQQEQLTNNHQQQQQLTSNQQQLQLQTNNHDQLTNNHQDTIKPFTPSITTTSTHHPSPPEHPLQPPSNLRPILHTLQPTATATAIRQDPSSNPYSPHSDHDLQPDSSSSLNTPDNPGSRSTSSSVSRASSARSTSSVQAVPFRTPVRAPHIHNTNSNPSSSHPETIPAFMIPSSSRTPILFNPSSSFIPTTTTTTTINPSHHHQQQQQQQLHHHHHHLVNPSPSTAHLITSIDPSHPYSPSNSPLPPLPPPLLSPPPPLSLSSSSSSSHSPSVAPTPLPLPPPLPPPPPKTTTTRTSSSSSSSSLSSSTSLPSKSRSSHLQPFHSSHPIQTSSSSLSSSSPHAIITHQNINPSPHLIQKIPNRIIPQPQHSHIIPTTKNPSSSLAINPQPRKGINDFLVGEILGEGSYSTVYHVIDKSTMLMNDEDGYDQEINEDQLKLKRKGGREYALKVLDKRHIQKEKKTKYVSIERDTLNLLDHHPGCIRLFSTFQDHSSLYYLLEYAPRGEILKAIKSLGSFSTDCARFYGAQILSAIEHIHSRGVIHRDIKPENILLDSEMRIKIADFGSAKILKPNPNSTTTNHDNSARSHSFVGTAEYVSPELLIEKVTSKTSDLWAFGCVLFQMMAGVPPFKSRSEYLTFQKITHLDYQFPDGFPGDAKDLISRLLVLEPNQRIGGSKEKGEINEIKTHAFFHSIDWDRLWDLTPPTLQPGIVVANNLNPRVVENVIAESIVNPTTTTPTYPGFYQEPTPLIAPIQVPVPSLPCSSQQQVVVAPPLPPPPPPPPANLEENLKALTVSSIVGEEEESESDEEPPKNGSVSPSINKRKSWLLNPSRMIFKDDDYSSTSNGGQMTWVEIYLPNELVIYSSTVNQLLSPQQTKVVVGFRTKKKRQLVLTDYPRLLCVKEDVKTSKVRLKYEIIFKPLPVTTTTATPITTTNTIAVTTLTTPTATTSPTSIYHLSGSSDHSQDPYDHPDPDRASSSSNGFGGTIRSGSRGIRNRNPTSSKTTDSSTPSMMIASSNLNNSHPRHRHTIHHHHHTTRTYHKNDYQHRNSKPIHQLQDQLYSPPPNSNPSTNPSKDLRIQNSNRLNISNQQQQQQQHSEDHSSNLQNQNQTLNQTHPFLLFKNAELEDSKRFRIETVRGDKEMKLFRFEDKSEGAAERWTAELNLAFMRSNP